MKFEILHQSKKSRARVGRIITPHGVIDTPGFVAVGTNGTLKAVDSTVAQKIGLQLMFCNTYHLMLQPGTEVVKKAGGLHQFMNRQHPIITDSGGFQVFSLAYGSVASELKGAGQKSTRNSVVKITDDGVEFRSYRDGKKVVLTPETSVQAQKDLGADIIIPFDELPPFHVKDAYLKESLSRTHEWEKRSLDTHLKNPNQQAMYGVIHGGIDDNLRAQSASYLTKLAFDGFAVGGSMGKTKDQMIHMLENLMPHIPTESPTHLLGIGDLESIERAIPLGLDTFDSTYPTKAARHGTLFTSRGNLKLSSTIHALSFGPIDKECSCPTCQNFSLAYLHHLFKARELTALSLASVHNLYFVINKFKVLREAILRDEI